MRPAIVNRNFALILAAIVAAILHGSLYPYDFHIHGGNPVAALIASWATGPSGRGDLAANILLYMPFGIFAVLAIGRPAPIWLVTLAGFAFSSTMELLQFYDEGRVTSASDVYLNTFGMWAGAIAGRALRGHRGWLRTGHLQAAPCLLLAAMLGYRLFPYVPTIDLHKYWHSLRPLIVHPAIHVFPLFHYFALWLTADYLVANAAKWKRPAWTAVALFAAFIFGAKVLIVDQSISPAELAGGGLAIGVWVFGLQNRRIAVYVVATVLCAAIVMQRLQPFDFRAAGAAFGWLPFRSFLSGSLAVNVQSFLEKIFLYGSLIWLAIMAGVRPSAATAAAAVLLFLTSLAQTHLPGRSGEITDTLLALAMGGVIAVLQPAARGLPGAGTEPGTQAG